MTRIRNEPRSFRSGFTEKIPQDPGQLLLYSAVGRSSLPVKRQHFGNSVRCGKMTVDLEEVASLGVLGLVNGRGVRRDAHDLFFQRLFVQEDFDGVFV